MRKQKSRTAIFRMACFALLLGSATSGMAKTKAAPPAAAKPNKIQVHTETTTERSLKVTAFAYTADSSQTDDSEDIGAWGDELDKKVPSIAVSRDLFDMGLKRGMKVRIKGHKGEYVVLDLMNPRWKKSIDIFKGKKKEARRWGRRSVYISWKTRTGTSNNLTAQASVSGKPETNLRAGPAR